MITRLPALFLVSGLAACAGAFVVGPARFAELIEPKVRARAAFDFECPANDIRVTPIDNRSFGAEGCGKRGTYVTEPASCNPTNLNEAGVEKYCSVVINHRSDAAPKASGQ